MWLTFSMKKLKHDFVWNIDNQTQEKNLIETDNQRPSPEDLPSFREVCLAIWLVWIIIGYGNKEFCYFLIYMMHQTYLSNSESNLSETKTEQIIKTHVSRYSKI